MGRLLNLAKLQINIQRQENKNEPSQVDSVRVCEEGNSFTRTTSSACPTYSRQTTKDVRIQSFLLCEYTAKHLINTQVLD